MSDALIRFRGVHKAFGPKAVFSGLDLDVERGQVLTVVGGSGVGKSVMLKLLIGLLKADAGTIHFREQDVRTPQGRWKTYLAGTSGGAGP